MFPKREAKADALKAWKAKRIGTDRDLVARIVADVSLRAKSHRPWLEGYVPHAATYIRGKRWEDAIDSAARRPPPALPQSVGIVPRALPELT